MNAIVAKLRRTLLVFALLPLPVLAQVEDLRMPVTIDADRTDYDGKTSMLRFTGLRLTQGGISIYADVAHASRMDFDDSIWRFSGNVVFDVNEGHVTCDSADLRFDNFQLRVATIEGSPATFELQRPGTQELTRATARRLHYDVVAGVVEFSGDATITEGGNRISSESLVYDIGAQRINAVSGGDGDDRVKVTFTPPEDEADGPPADEDGEP
jgi:lipopolysaccharide export system protein LptA